MLEAKYITRVYRIEPQAESGHFSDHHKKKQKLTDQTSDIAKSDFSSSFISHENALRSLMFSVACNFILLLWESIMN